MEIFCLFFTYFLLGMFTWSNNSNGMMLKAAKDGDLFHTKVAVFSEDVNQRDKHGRTPLFVSVAYGKEAVADALITAKAGVDRAASTGMFHGDGLNPLELAAFKGDLRMVEKLIQAGADVNQVDHRGFTPLLWAAFKGRQDVALVLLSAGANVSYCERTFGSTPLYWAVMHGNKELVAAFIAAGADPNVTEKKEGETPLHIAYKVERLDIAQLLIDAGADLSIKDKSGKSLLALKLAIELRMGAQ